MFSFFTKAPALQLVAQADTTTKLVLLALVVLSVFCIWIVLSKFFVFQRQKKVLNEVRTLMEEAKTFDDLVALSKQYQDSAAGKLLIKGLTELKDALRDNKKVDIEHLQILLEQSLEHILSEEEQYLPVLATSAAVAPLVGLFGTVLGLIHVFVSISQQKSADPSVVAPGIAEALTTTLAGLFVAIPALVFFHYFSNEMRRLEFRLLGILDRFILIVRKTLL